MRRLFVTLWLVGCGGSTAEGATAPDDAIIDGAGDGASDGAGEASSGDASMKADVAVADAEGETVGGDAGPAFKTPIRYVFVIVKENHTFENYFTDFPGATDGPKVIDRAGAAGNITRTAAPATYASDIGHSNDDGRTAYNAGRMNGFETFGYHFYTEQQIPAYWKLARRFVLADHFFSTVMAPTAPGHFAVWTSQAPFHGNARAPAGVEEHKCGQTVNATRVPVHMPGKCEVGEAFPCFDVPILPDVIKAPLTWRRYGPNGGGPFALVEKYGGNTGGANFRSHEDDLLPDLAAGDLANVTIVNVNNGQWKGRNISEHPPQNPCHGESWTVEVVRRLMDGPHWKETAILITYDDWGGWYDSVPPKVEKCDDGSAYPGGEFFHTGFRLPLIIVSPYAKPGYVLKTVTEQASIPKLIEEVFALQTMASLPSGRRARDATAGSLLDAFDFMQIPLPPIPASELSPRTCP